MRERIEMYLSRATERELRLVLILLQNIIKEG